MARTVLEEAFPPDWIDEVFEAHRRCQYARELLFSNVFELMTFVVLGLRPSLHLAVHIRSGFEGSAIALPPEHWLGPVEGGMADLVERLLQLARRIDSKRLAAVVFVEHEAGMHDADTDLGAESSPGGAAIGMVGEKRIEPVETTGIPRCGLYARVSGQR